MVWRFVNGSEGAKKRRERDGGDDKREASAGDESGRDPGACEADEETLGGWLGAQSADGLSLIHI